MPNWDLAHNHREKNIVADSLAKHAKKMGAKRDIFEKGSPFEMKTVLFL